MTFTYKMYNTVIQYTIHILEKLVQLALNKFILMETQPE